MNHSGIIDYQADLFFYQGPILRQGYSQLSELLENKESKYSTVCLVLVTYGGDPDAAYRMARALRHHYDEVEILIPDLCKSAGTLLCIGANKLIFGDRGELGPLDIQLSKPDELFENMSGLDIIQAINVLQSQVQNAFREYLIDIRGGSNIRTKTAAEIATKLSSGFVAPILEKIDPMTLGEHQRAMQIANDYGLRLNDMSASLQPGALNRLIASYPSHGFVIDRKEAASLFANVTKPDDKTLPIYQLARLMVEKFTDNQLRIFDLKEFAKNLIKPNNTKDLNSEESGDEFVNNGADIQEASNSGVQRSTEGSDEDSIQESTGNESSMDISNTETTKE